MNKKLRLLVTTRCPNKCPMCCNNSWDFNKLPVVDRWNYEEIMVTGGEPLLFMDNLDTLVEELCMKALNYNKYPNIYVYTSYFKEGIDSLKETILNPYIAGIVLTLHNKEDAEVFTKLNIALNHRCYKGIDKSLRLNLFPDMKALLPKDIDLSLWQVKDMEWIENCPVPEGEDFRRIANLW